MRGNKSPAPPARTAPRGGELNPKRLNIIIVILPETIIFSPGHERTYRGTIPAIANTVKIMPVRAAAIHRSFVHSCSRTHCVALSFDVIATKRANPKVCLRLLFETAGRCYPRLPPQRTHTLVPVLSVPGRQPSCPRFLRGARAHAVCRSPAQRDLGFIHRVFPAVRVIRPCIAQRITGVVRHPAANLLLGAIHPGNLQ